MARGSQKSNRRDVLRYILITYNILITYVWILIFNLYRGFYTHNERLTSMIEPENEIKDTSFSKRTKS